MTITELATSLGITFADIVEIWTASDPDVSDQWLVVELNGAAFADQTLTDMGVADITSIAKEARNG